MTSWAWDLEQNVRESTTFVVTHARDKSDGGPVALEGERDIYENNANMGARRERAMIERILPVWFVEIAVDTARKTLAGDPNEFLPRVDKAVKTFSAWGIKQEHLEAKLGGVPRDNWRDVDLATLVVLYQSLQRQETTVDEEFPDLRTGKSAKSVLEEAAADAGQAAPPAPAGDPPVRYDRDGAIAQLDALFTEAEVADNAARLAVLGMLVRADPKEPPVPVSAPADLTDENLAKAMAKLLAVRVGAQGKPRPVARVREDLLKLATAAGWKPAEEAK